MNGTVKNTKKVKTRNSAAEKHHGCDTACFKIK